MSGLDEIRERRASTIPSSSIKTRIGEELGGLFIDLFWVTGWRWSMDVASRILCAFGVYGPRLEDDAEPGEEVF
jgi:hypothetical protein